MGRSALAVEIVAEQTLRGWTAVGALLIPFLLTRLAHHVSVPGTINRIMADIESGRRDANIAFAARKAATFSLVVDIPTWALWSLLDLLPLSFVYPVASLLARLLAYLLEEARTGSPRRRAFMARRVVRGALVLLADAVLLWMVVAMGVEVFKPLFSQLAA